MQLKLKRTQRDSGVMSKSVVFCLDARAEYTPEEMANIRRYKLHKQVIYNSESALKHLNHASNSVGRETAGGYLSGMASLVMAKMNLNISVESLEKGQHIECKSLEELLSAEDQLLEACKHLKEFLDVAATFDGREVVFKFDGETPELVSATPALAAPAQVTHQPAAPIVQTAIPEQHPSGTKLEPPRPYERPDDSFFPRAPREDVSGWDKYLTFIRGKLPSEYKDNAPAAAVALILAGLVFLWWLWITLT